MDDILIDFIKKKLLVGQEDLALTAEDDLLESGLIDSLGAMRLIAFMEESFDIQVPPEDMVIENFESVKAMSNYIQTKQV